MNVITRVCEIFKMFCVSNVDIKINFFLLKNRNDECKF